MTGIPNNGVDQRTYEANAQMLGAQRDTVRRKDLAKAADAGASTETQDQVELGQQGQEAGVHTGATQNLAGQAQRLAAARAAMAKGGLQAGDVAPGEQQQGAQAAATPQAGATPQGAPQPGAAPIGGPQMQGGGAVPPGGVPPGFGGPGMNGPVPPMGGSLSQAAQAAQASQQDAQQAQTIYWQMAADRQKAMADIWKIFQDLQTTMFQKMQEVMLYRQQVMDKISAKWAEVLRA